MNTQNPNTQSELNFTKVYLQLRQTIGWLGLLLPFLLMIGGAIASCSLVFQQSLSHYFFSHMHIVFVGILCIVGILLVCYRSPIKNNKLENWLSTIAGICCFGVATFPTQFEGFKENALQYITVSEISKGMGMLHFGFAAILFACFAWMCFKTFHFGDSQIDTIEKQQKKNYRNKWYTTCGWGITISVGIIFIIFLIDDDTKKIAATYYTTTIFETTSLFFFGSSWIIKGSKYWEDSKVKILKGLKEHFRG